MPFPRIWPTGVPANSTSSTEGVGYIDFDALSEPWPFAADALKMAAGPTTRGYYKFDRYILPSPYPVPS